MAKSHEHTIQSKTYPEFNGLSKEEIEARLIAFDSLINTQMAKEYTDAQQEQEWLLKQSSQIQKAGTIQETTRDFWVIAHRGWSGSYPENTLIGLREAIRLGCHMIEFDVTLTQDRKMIIIHDVNLSRTTNGYGKVMQHTFQQLRKLDAGSWFHPKYTGAHLPTLEEILLISKGTGIMINIEIKKECWDESLQPDGIEHQVIKAIEQYGVQDRVIMSSFKWSFIKRINTIAPHIQKALLHYKNTSNLEPLELKKKYGIVSFNPQEIELNQKFVNKCHDAGLKLLPFTINSYKDMEQYLNMGVDGMFTNHPNRLFKFLEEHSIHLKEMRNREEVENKSDIQDAIQRLEEEEMDKARKRARWRAKRLVLENQKKVIESQYQN